MGSYDTNTKPILILGAGISGLCFAQALLKNHPTTPFRIFERDALFNQRAQGYRVRLDGTGQDALKACLSEELFERLEKSCAHSTKGMGPVWLLDALTGERCKGLSTGPPGIWRVESVGSQPAPEKPHADIVDDKVALNADRTVLRGVLIRGLEDYVEFGKELVGFETTTEGVRVRFTDGSEVEGCLLVGADGARSRVRKQLVPELEVVDTGGRFIFGKTMITPQLLEKFDKRPLDGMSMVLDKTGEMSMSLVLEPVRFKDNEFRSDLPDDYIYWVLLARGDWFKVDDEKLRRLPPNEAAALSRKSTANWHSSFHTLFELQDVAKSSVIRIISVRPDIPTWDSSKHVTLIGDAAHVMSPTAGAGGTTAIRDAATLSQVLSGQGSLAENVARYENLMRTYAQDVVARSASGGNFLFGMRSFEELKAMSL